MVSVTGFYRKDGQKYKRVFCFGRDNSGKGVESGMCRTEQGTEGNGNKHI